MENKKCCVGGCNATSSMYRCFCFPKNDKLRNLWMSFVVPTNSLLIGLSKEQLLRKYVCEKHFDKTQFDCEGKRLRWSYPCLFTADEISHGVPLASAEWGVTLEHNYFKEQDEEEYLPDQCQSEQGLHEEHNYFKEHLADNNIISPLLMKNVSSSDQPSTSNKEVKEVAEFQNALCTHNSAVVSVPEIMGPYPTGLDCNDENIVVETVPKINKTVQPQKCKDLSVRNLRLKKRKMLKEISNTSLESLGNPASQRLTKAIEIFTKKDLLEKFDLLNKQAQTFLLMQLKQVCKSKMARRFTLDEKLMALLMLKQSPKGYKLLETMFALPNKRTLMRLSEKIQIDTGLNPQIFEHISHNSKNWSPQQKLCSIVFDEVALTPHLTYNENKEKILGFVDVGGNPNNVKFCDHALVFMLRGICSRWRQSVAYYFCEGTISAIDLERILKELVSHVALCGLIPLVLICDQGSTFRSTLKHLREETIKKRSLQGVFDDGSINVAGHDLSIVYDPPHLLKGLRNNFISKDIIWEGKTASWKDIQFVFDIDSKLGHTRALPKLTAHHVDATRMKKMKVSVAAQVLSARTAAMLKYTDALNKLRGVEEATMATTAEVIIFFDKLFDSVNGHAGGAKRGKLRSAVKPNSQHHEFWIDSIRKIKDIHFIDKNSKIALQSGNHRHVKVPSLHGWITTLESFLRLSKLLFNKFAVDYFYPRNVNQDPLENFFGRIRALNYRNVNPDANIFAHSFKSLMITNILTPHSKNANCEEDDGEQILNVKNLFGKNSENKENVKPKPQLSSPSSSSQGCANQPRKFSVGQVVMEKVKVHCSAYTAGYVCRKISKSVNCKACLGTLTTKKEENIHLYIRYREYHLLKNKNLKYPTQQFLILYRDVASLIHDYLDKNCYKGFINTVLKEKIKNMRISWLGCSRHHELVVANFINILIRLQTHNWCNIINKILKGDITEKYVNEMGEPQKKAFHKYKCYRLKSKIKEK